MKRRLMAVAIAAAVVGTAGAASAQVDDDGLDPFAEDDPGLAPEPEPAPAPEPVAEASSHGALPGAGTFGIGAVQTPSGVRGIEGEYYLSSVMISGVLGFQTYSPAEGESVTAYAAAGGAFYPLLGGADTSLMAGGRLVLGHASVADFSSTQFNIELPARLQWHFSPRLAVHFETGLVIAIIPEESEVVGVAPGFGRAEGVAVSFGRASLLGNAGMTIYF